GLPRQQTHLHRTHELLAIIWRDAFGSGGIEATKYLVQVYAAALCAGCIEPRTQPVRALGRIGQTLHERAKIQPGSDGENRSTIALTQIREHFEGKLAILTGTKDFRGWDQIDHVVSNMAAFVRRRLRRTDITTSIHLRGIAGDNLSAQSSSQGDRQRRFPRSRGPEDGHEGQRG